MDSSITHTRNNGNLQYSLFSGVCLTTDIDTFLNHMNNARFLREIDFARVDFYERTGLYTRVKSKGGSLAVTATSIRYRRFIKLFQRFRITSKVSFSCPLIFASKQITMRKKKRTTVQAQLHFSWPTCQ